MNFETVLLLVKVEGSDDAVSKSHKASTTKIQVKKSNAQKCKEYRERKKLEKVRVQKNSAQRFDECRQRDQLKEMKKPKSEAQRSKEYRERQKIKKQIELQQKNTDHLRSKSTKTPAEYMREYRRKVKLKIQSIQLNSLLAKDHSDARADKMPNKNSRVCSCHFKDGTKSNGPTIFNHDASQRFEFGSPPGKKRTKRAENIAAAEVADDEVADSNPLSQLIIKKYLAKSKQKIIHFETRNIIRNATDFFDKQ